MVVNCFMFADRRLSGLLDVFEVCRVFVCCALFADGCELFAVC